MTRARCVCSMTLLLSLFSLRSQCSLAQDTKKDAGMSFHVSFAAAKSAAPLDGRLLVMFSTDNAQEPRFQITGDANTQLVFGINVDGLKPGEAAVVDRSVLGYP